ncbi:hypothetical protein SADUNF_Sadunf09G0049500 [Salix dunnii]|uniref:Anthocyanin acyltransferase n=1 Tax=Salix dunnii TaxID=1413687 RepID=A0A835MT33_9ROSI|nr:hypothetical protein SADUNF_Sadunf09G0049500 [Salix dunnii]
MAKSSTIKVVEHSKVSPPPNSAPPTVLPLTFLDIPWLFFSPSQTLSFYEYPHFTSHFLSTTLHNLKHSLSLALQHFFPFAGNLVLSPAGSNKPNVVYNEGDSVSFTVAESSGDFSYFTSNHARDVNGFYPLVPKLATASVAADTQVEVVPLLAVQVTVFPNSGICIGLAYHHVVADGRTFNNFIKTWALLCAHGCSLPIDSLPSYHRSVIKDEHGLEEIFLKELWKRKSSRKMVLGPEAHVDLPGMVRATFVMNLEHMERIKNWIVVQCKNKNRPQPVHLSAYVLTCAFVWVCLVKATNQRGGSENYCYSRGEDPIHFGFIAGGMSRFDFPVPATYFGNCVGFGRSTATRNELMGEDGIIIAANAIGSTIRRLDKEMCGGAEKWISEWEVMLGSAIHTIVSGSPKLDLYETDFGWRRPKKIEDISIDKMRAISLIESRDEKGGIEVGLALPAGQMDAFKTLLIQELKALQ